VVERGTLPGQRTVLATLADVASRASAEGIRAPAITLVGDVAALHSRLAWLEERPLYGRTVAVTRARAQASSLAARLRELGATVIEAPAIRVQPLNPMMPEPSDFDLLCVTSPNGAELLMDQLRDARALAGVRVAAVGPGTARALRARGIEADIVASRAVAEGLVEALDGVPVERAWIVRASGGRTVLRDALLARGADVSESLLYETVAEPLDEATITAARDADWITFTSSSTVRYFLEAAGPDALRVRPRVVSIGPVTSDTLRENGVVADVEAAEHDIDGVIRAILEDARR
jgi:uroporphyrinogen III methyltransferase / synthase